jgi:SHS2 domain-containing protein
LAVWEHFHHLADIGVRGIDDTLEGAFEYAAAALMAVVCDTQSVKPDISVEIQCTAPDTEILLADWLNALIYEMDVRKMLFSKFRVQIDGNTLRAVVYGEKTDTDRHSTAVEVKAATYMELKVARNSKGLWVAQCVVDV